MAVWLSDASRCVVSDFDLDLTRQFRQWHSWVKTTEQHYAAWSQARQQQAEQDVTRAWGREATVRHTARQGSRSKKLAKSQ